MTDTDTPTRPPTPAPAYCGKLPDAGDGVTIYVHGLHGFAIHTHRTVRTTPAGWVWGVYDETGQYAYGYAGTRGDAVTDAADYITGPPTRTWDGRAR